MFNPYIFFAMFRRDVKDLADVLNLCLRQNGLETPLMQHRIIAAWDDVVGNVIAGYTAEKSISNQTFFVKITNPALRSDLSMMKSQLVRRLNAAVGQMVIADIRIY